MKREVKFIDGTVITVNELMDANYGCYIWPSALVLGQYLVKNKQIVNQPL